MTRQILNRLGILGSQRGQGYILCAVSAVRADRTLLQAVTTRREFIAMLADYEGNILHAKAE